MSSPEQAVETAILEEQRRAERAGRVADVACALLSQTPALGPAEALEIMEEARRAVLELFPGKETVFDLLYRPRFLRIVAERFPLSDHETGPIS
jgi:hypothetical protein